VRRARRTGFTSLVLLLTAVAWLVAPGVAPSRPSAVSVSFSGSGNRTLRPFRVSSPSTLVWRNSGKLFALNPRLRSFNGAVSSTAHSGTSYLPPGRYLLNALARGSWRFQVRPGTEPIRRSGGAIVFSGNGRKALPPVRLKKDSYLHWSSAPGLFQMRNATTSAGAVSSRARRGISYLPPGVYRLQVISAIGRWSMRITGI
jgi:hypothetical protein